MSTIYVVDPGLFTTVQDLGREGFGPLGVSASGAADSLSLRLGNRLVGNAENAAGLEMTLVGGTFEFRESAVASLTGSDFGATLDGARVEPWTSIDIRRGSVLRAGATRSGARCYLCVHGGIVVRPFLGSASTHVMTGLGGLDGRPLRRGDVMKIGAPTALFRKRSVAPRVGEVLSPRSAFRVTAGEQSEWFSQSTKRALVEHAYRVSEHSNRMGIRLEGTPIAEQTSGRMVTEGVSLGAVQVPPGGLPIILFVEQQTTGGYPKIANVISADLSRLGQLRPRDEVRFERVEMERARELLIEQERLLASPGVIVE